MKQLTDGFKRLGARYIPSFGNFVIVSRGRGGRRCTSACCRQGVIVRPIGVYGLPEHLRVTIGLEHENERFLRALPAALHA